MLPGRISSLLGVSHDDNATVLSHNTRNKGQRVAPVINISPETGEGSSLQLANLERSGASLASPSPWLSWQPSWGALGLLVDSLGQLEGAHMWGELHTGQKKRKQAGP